MQFYNLYTSTPRVRLAKPHTILHSLYQSDKQYLLLSNFDSDFLLKGSSFFNKKNSLTERVTNAGSILRLHPNLKKVTRFILSFKKRALNFAAIEFKQPIPIPLWAESLEFWSMGNGVRHKIRAVYKDSSGKNYFLDFGKTAHYGWLRMARAIPLRQNRKLSFAQRYRRLWLTKLLILDDHATGKKRSLYHIAGVAASRIIRTLKNQQENWRFKPVFDFKQQNMTNLKIKFFGYTNIESKIQPYNAQLSNRFSANFLHLTAEQKKEGFKRIILRFKKPIRVEICRKIILSIKGSGAREKIYFLIRNVLKKHYLLYGGSIKYQGWRKLHLDVPRWIVQKTKNLVENKGLYLLEILIVPTKERFFKKLSLGLDNLAVVEDKRRPFFPGIKMFDYW